MLVELLLAESIHRYKGVSIEQLLQTNLKIGNTVYFIIVLHGPFCCFSYKNNLSSKHFCHLFLIGGFVGYMQQVLWKTRAITRTSLECL